MSHVAPGDPLRLFSRIRKNKDDICKTQIKQTKHIVSLFFSPFWTAEVSDSWTALLGSAQAMDKTLAISIWWLQAP